MKRVRTSELVEAEESDFVDYSDGEDYASADGAGRVAKLAVAAARDLARVARRVSNIAKVATAHGFEIEVSQLTELTQSLELGKRTLETYTAAHFVAQAGGEVADADVVPEKLVFDALSSSPFKDDVGSTLHDITDSDDPGAVDWYIAEWKYRSKIKNMMRSFGLPKWALHAELLATVKRKRTVLSSRRYQVNCVYFGGDKFAVEYTPESNYMYSAEIEMPVSRLAKMMTVSEFSKWLSKLNPTLRWKLGRGDNAVPA